jgi:large subunit ribosomal protein L6
MSRIGKTPIAIPSGVEVKVAGGVVTVKGPKGENSWELPACITVEVADGQVLVGRTEESKNARSLHGTIRSVINNMLIGVEKGYEKELEISGVGYKAQMQGTTCILALGFSHEIKYEIPAGVTVEVDKAGVNVKVSGHDKALVGQVAARIRAFSPAEPYKGKGVKYKGEQIRRKEGKAVA